MQSYTLRRVKRSCCYPLKAANWRTGRSMGRATQLKTHSNRKLIKMIGAQLKFTRQDLSIWFCSACLVVLILTIIVQINYNPAVPSDKNEFLDQAVLGTQGGDSYKRYIHLFIFLIILGLFCIKNFRIVLSAISVPYMLAAMWCLLSCAWAISPNTSLKRSFGMFILLIGTSTIVNIIGSARAIKLLYYVFAVTLILSLISVALSSMPLFAFAVHPANEADASLIGNWRGVFFHKNVAGPVMTHAAALFLHFGINRRSRYDWLLFVASVLFIIGTRSKTAVALLIIILVAGLVYRAFFKRQNGSVNFCVFTASFLLCLLVMGIVEADAISKFFNNPLNLTGRVAIWMSLMDYIKLHPWLGAGYGSFWGIGYASPIFKVARSDFVLTVLQSHNGYLEILATTGVIGLALALVALVVVPFYELCTGSRQNADLNALCFSMWLFGILQNFTEAQFFSPDKQSWIIVVIAITIIHCEKVKEKGIYKQKGHDNYIASNIIRDYS